jgi:hypothetical protein
MEIIRSNIMRTNQGHWRNTGIENGDRFAYVLPLTITTIWQNSELKVDFPYLKDLPENFVQAISLVSLLKK